MALENAKPHNWLLKNQRAIIYSWWGGEHKQKAIISSWKSWIFPSKYRQVTNSGRAYIKCRMDWTTNSRITIKNSWRNKEQLSVLEKIKSNNLPLKKQSNCLLFKNKGKLLLLNKHWAIACSWKSKEQIIVKMERAIQFFIFFSSNQQRNLCCFFCCYAARAVLRSSLFPKEQNSTL